MAWIISYKILLALRSPLLDRHGDSEAEKSKECGGGAGGGDVALYDGKVDGSETETRPAVLEKRNWRREEKAYFIHI